MLKKGRRKNWFIIRKNIKTVQFIIGILIILVIFIKVNPIETFRILFSVNLTFFILSIICYLILNLSHAIRLKIALKYLNYNVKLIDTFQAQSFGMLLGDITPARVGYASVTYPLKKRNKVPITRTMSAIAIYQGIEFLLKGLQGVLGVLFLLWFFVLSGEILYISIVALLFAVMLGMLLLILPTHKFVKTLKIMKKLTAGKLNLNFFEEIQKNSKILTKRAILPIFFLTFIGWFIRATEWFFIGKALGLNISWIFCLFLHPIMSALTFVPFSPAGLGIYEGAIILMFSLFSISPTSALAFSFLDRINNILTDSYAIKEVFK
ncbi:MAG: lysylphosphatidylglycerol synthase transmembrane domain-containing protein [Candidatus Aenigmatarchaeota archaeon]